LGVEERKAVMPETRTLSQRGVAGSRNKLLLPGVAEHRAGGGEQPFRVPNQGSNWEGVISKPKWKNSARGVAWEKKGGVERAPIDRPRGSRHSSRGEPGRRPAVHGSGKVLGREHLDFRRSRGSAGDLANNLQESGGEKRHSYTENTLGTGCRVLGMQITLCLSGGDKITLS